MVRRGDIWQHTNEVPYVKSVSDADLAALGYVKAADVEAQLLSQVDDLLGTAHMQAGFHQWALEHGYVKLDVDKAIIRATEALWDGGMGAYPIDVVSGLARMAVLAALDGEET